MNLMNKVNNYQNPLIVKKAPQKDKRKLPTITEDQCALLYL